MEFAKETNKKGSIMTVKRLIELLESCRYPDAEIILHDPNGEKVVNATCYVNQKNCHS
jgi:hypothetical protein